MIGVLVFTLLGIGLTAMALYNYRSAQINIMKNTAYATAQGFIEQIKSIPETSIKEAIASPSSSPLPTRSVSALNTGGVTHVDSPLYLSDPAATAKGENHRRILIDQREDTNGQIRDIYMDMWFDVNISRLTSASGYKIEITFDYENPSMATYDPLPNTLRMIRTSGTSNP